MGLTLCKSEEWFDFEGDTVIPYLVGMTIIYTIVFYFLTIRFVSSYIVIHSRTINSYVITFQVIIILSLLFRLPYFPGIIRPFCYGRELYLILGEYPSLFQSIAISMLILLFIKTLQALTIESNRKYITLTKMMMTFVVIYPMMFVGVHTLELVYKNDEKWKTIKYLLLTTGQSFVLLFFTILSHKLIKQLTPLDSQLSSPTFRILLILTSFLFFTRIVLAILNLSKITHKYKGLKYFFLYSLISMLCFDIAPTITLAFLFSFQDSQNKETQSKRKISELLD